MMDLRVRPHGPHVPVNQLQARLLLIEEGKKNGTPWLVPYLELRNEETQLKVRCVNSNAKFTLVEADGKTVRNGQSLPRSGPHPDPGTVTVPLKGSVRLWMGCTNWGIPGNAAAMIQTDIGAWVLEPKDKGKVFLWLTLQGDKIENDTDRVPTWHGKIELSVPVTWGEPGDDIPPGATSKKMPAPDLSKFPKLKGKVVHSLGYPHSYGPPETGHQFELDLAGLAKMKSLPFDAAKESYLPIPGQRLVVDNLYVDERGGFSTMRLVAKGETSTLRIDISPKPGLGPKRVLVWVVIESHGVIDHVTLIDCEADGEFPRLTNTGDEKDDLKGTWIVTDDGGENPVRPDGHAKDTKWVVKDGVIHFGHELKLDAAKQPIRFYALDRTSNPARITITNGVRIGSTSLVQPVSAEEGIYEVDGDTLRLFLDPLSYPKAPPAAFPKGAGVLTMKRAPKE